jgi:hypothetical protein
VPATQSVSDYPAKPGAHRAVALQALHRCADRAGDRRRAGATVFRALKKPGLRRLSGPEPAVWVQRCEYAAPGDLIHLDIKKLARFEQTGHRITGDRTRSTPGAGGEFLHVSIDDHSRVALTGLFPDERSASAVGFLHSMVAAIARSVFRSAYAHRQRILLSFAAVPCRLSPTGAQARRHASLYARSLPPDSASAETTS